MKIVAKDNFNRDLFVEEVVAENVNSVYGKQLIDAWNERHCGDYSENFLELVKDDYVPYNGYKNL